MHWKLQENILEKDDLGSLISFIKTTKRFTQFIRVKEFERAWSKWQGCKYSVFVNSGSSANLILISSLKEMYGWEKGDEIIVPAVTWPTNVTPVIQFGLKPVFVDINLKDLSFDYGELKKSITHKTRAIFVTHLIGLPADIPRIKTMIRGRDIALLEDCCESHGARIDGKKIGNFGQAGTFSFYWGHHITTVEGGMVCTHDEELYKLCLLKRSHGLARELPEKDHRFYSKKFPDIDFNFLFLTDGFNLRNSEFNANLGLSQLNKIDNYIRIRNRNYRNFIDICQRHRKFLRIVFDFSGISSFCLPFVFKDERLMKKFRLRLIEGGIESRPLISGNLLNQPFLKKYRLQEQYFPHAELIHRNAFYIGNNQFVDNKRLGALGKMMEDFFRCL
jgi:CDP-6-deoxy-D-xylo-4-hexulose-3-dehydrase